MELCKEVERLRQIADERHSAYSDYTKLSFGKHSGSKLTDVPDDYLRWWFSQNPDRSIIKLDSEYGPQAKRQIARNNLKLYDYIVRRFNGQHEQDNNENTGQSFAE